MKINNLQYQASNGSWIDCENRTDRLIDKCAETIDGKKSVQRHAVSRDYFDINGTEHNQIQFKFKSFSTTYIEDMEIGKSKDLRAVYNWHQITGEIYRIKRININHVQIQLIKESDCIPVR